MIFSVGLDRFLTAVAVSPTLRTAHRAVAPHHIKVRILSPRQVGYELRWAASEFSSFKLPSVQCLRRSNQPEDCDLGLKRGEHP
jgi:hypothetical protein